MRERIAYYLHGATSRGGGLTGRARCAILIVAQHREGVVHMPTVIVEVDENGLEGIDPPNPDDTEPE